METDLFSGLADDLKRHDRDRFLATLWAPAAHRDGLLALLSFNLDLGRLRETVSQALLAEIRLQWWRDALAEIRAGAAPRRHPILAILAPLLTSGRIEAAPLERMIDARARDWDGDPPADLDALAEYARDTGGALAESRAVLLGARGEADIQAARLVGTSWALTGLIRALPFNIAKGRITVPANMAADAGLDIARIASERDTPALRAVVFLLMAQAREALSEARLLRKEVSKAALPVLAEALVAEAYLKRLITLKLNVFDAGFGEPDALAAWRLGFSRVSGRY